MYYFSILRTLCTLARPYKCNLCDKSYSESKHLRAHRKRIHKLESEFIKKCNICDMLFYSKDNLNVHLSAHKKDLKNSAESQVQLALPLNPKVNVKCGHCPKLFPISAIEEHQKKCNKTNPLKSKIDAKNLVFKVSTCKFCQIKLKLPHFNSTTSKKHVQQCEKYHSFVGNGLVCKFCKTNKQYKLIGTLFKHFDDVHSQEILTIQKNEVSLSDREKLICATIQKSSSSMITPIPKTASKKLICVLCVYLGKNEMELENHYINKHFRHRINTEIIPKLPSTEPFQCPNCDYNACYTMNIAPQIKGQHLMFHYLRQHGALKKFISESSTTGMEFQIKNPPNIDITISDSGLPNIEKCLLCKFKNQTPNGSIGNMYQTMETHYWNNHFYEKINTEVQPLISKNPPFECPASDCDVKTQHHRYNLLKHYLRKHGIWKKYINDLMDEQPLALIKKRKNQTKNCNDSEENPQTDKSFAVADLEFTNDQDSEMMSEEEEGDHQKRKIYTCTICEKDFPDQDTFMDHSVIAHTNAKNDNVDELVKVSQIGISELKTIF